MRVKVLKNGAELQRMVFDSDQAKQEWLAHLGTGQSAWGDFSQLTVVEEDMSAEIAAKASADAASEQVHQFLKKFKKSDIATLADCADVLAKIIKHIRADQ